MTPAKAKVIFATHMQAARKRKLTEYELQQLNTARQVLRMQRRPAMNPTSVGGVLRLNSKGSYYYVADGFSYRVVKRLSQATVFPDMEAAKAFMIRNRLREDLVKGETIDWLPVGSTSKPVMRKNAKRNYGRYVVMGKEGYRGIPYRVASFPTIKEAEGYAALASERHTKMIFWVHDNKADKLPKFTVIKGGKSQSNPKRVLIYGETDTIYARKTQNHICDDDCKKHGHRYYHKFSSKPRMYGLPNGDLLITGS